MKFIRCVCTDRLKKIQVWAHQATLVWENCSFHENCTCYCVKMEKYTLKNKITDIKRAKNKENALFRMECVHFDDRRLIFILFFNFISFFFFLFVLVLVYSLKYLILRIGIHSREKKTSQKQWKKILLTKAIRRESQLHQQINYSIHWNYTFSRHFCLKSAKHFKKWIYFTSQRANEEKSRKMN